MFRLIVHTFLPLVLALGVAAGVKLDERKLDEQVHVSIESMKGYYRFDSLERSGRSVALLLREPTGERKVTIDVRFRIGSRECRMNGMKFVLSYPVTESGGRAWISKIDLAKLVDPILRPNQIASISKFRTVIIDPGHGGRDPGATNSLGTEAEYNLRVARYVKRFLEQHGYRVRMTRDDDRFLSLQERVDLANKVREDAVFVSIHHNSASGSSARGIETFTLSPVGVSHYGRGLKASDFKARAGNRQDAANVALATAVHGVLLKYLEEEKTGRSYTFDRGIKRARFSVLSGVKHPSILVECGFMSHSYDARLIDDTDYQERVAKAIADGIHRFRRAVGSRSGS